ncbi:fha domain containing protein [Colletotrichum karsti]|uniref:Fha domain containing protein n=1 Tax=Colletotrichum karsti TaxID=1095194 RepID=A0A9P6ID01_9PEZI|nr:fha domain containing protein [Colletotrichum karsti]KAF9878286.1 fha domain containing protein [Colletotrichum karsti]
MSSQASARILPNRSISRGAPLAADIDTIQFPRAWETAWEAAGQSNFERAQAFLFFYRGDDAAVNSELRLIASNPKHQDVASLAAEVQQRVFNNRHASFDASPLLQWMRFILIKSQLPASSKTKPVRDFFFDPSIARNLPQPPDDPAEYEYPAAPLNIMIVGGGPTGLASAIALAEKAGSKVEVHVHEGRWARQPGSSFVSYPPDARRRDQVVTLQDSVTGLMSEETRQAVFGGCPERVWPGSSNLQIRKLEDGLLRRAQDSRFRDIIFLHASRVRREELARYGDFHILLGADGAGSWVRGSCFEGQDEVVGKSYALGVAFDRPRGLPRPQPINVFLTMAQTRYLLNASDFDGTGYLNMQLTEAEWDQMVSVDGHPCTFGKPSCLETNGRLPTGFQEHQVFAPSRDPDSPLWKAILDGLELYGFKECDVTTIVRIPIVVRRINKAVEQLPILDSSALQRPHGLVALAGDAAMTVHFWPGRGANSGIKAGIAWADEVAQALGRGHLVGLRTGALGMYEAFMQKLQQREHGGRSLPIVKQSGDPEMMAWLMRNARLIPRHVAMEWLMGTMWRDAVRIEQRPDWAFERVGNLEPQLRRIMETMDAVTLQEMAATFPWPTREMAGAEVMPMRSVVDACLGGGKPKEMLKLEKDARARKQEKRKKATSADAVMSGADLSPAFLVTMAGAAKPAARPRSWRPFGFSRTT